MNSLHLLPQTETAIWVLFHYMMPLPRMGPYPSLTIFESSGTTPQEAVTFSSPSSLILPSREPRVVLPVFHSLFFVGNLCLRRSMQQRLLLHRQQIYLLVALLGQAVVRNLALFLFLGRSLMKMERHLRQ